MKNIKKKKTDEINMAALNPILNIIVQHFFSTLQYSIALLQKASGTMKNVSESRDFVVWYKTDDWLTVLLAALKN